MKIAQVNLQTDYGGAERHVLLLARGLRDAGHEVRVFCHPGGRLRREAESAGIATGLVSARNQIDLGAALRLAMRLRRWRPDVVHLHTPREYVGGTLAARCAGVPATVITRHMVRPVNALMRRVYGRTGAVLCLTRAVRDNLAGQGIPPEKLELVYGAIDTTEFAVEAGKGAALAVGIVGRLVGGKGHACFLEAAARFSAASPLPAKFLIVGDGPERPTLEALAGRLGLSSDRVVFTGFRGDMPAVMASLDILVLASTDAEVLPLVVMEALAAGRAVVATRVGGVPEIVEDAVTGLLVPPGDTDALAGALRRLAADPELRARLGVAGKRKVEAQFSLPRMIAETERVYRRLCDGNNGD